MFGKSCYVDANFTSDYEFYNKQINATAYKWDPALQTWTTDNTVNIRAVFKSAFNFTETDALRSDLEAQTTDETALKIAFEDLYDCGVQTFVGAGSLSADLRRSGPLYYELLVEAGRSAMVVLRRTIQLNFRNNQPCHLPLNFDSNSPLNITVLTDDAQSVLLLIDAPMELGGLANITIYQITNTPTEQFEALSKTQLGLKVLKTIELTVPQKQTQAPLNYTQDFQQFYQYYQGGSTIFDDNLGFEGQIQLAVAKNQNTKALTQTDKALLYVEATNVWGTTFHTIIPYNPMLNHNGKFP
jgi:hypothetical protein